MDDAHDANKIDQLSMVAALERPPCEFNEKRTGVVMRS
jgi:hypothetical protein